MTLITLCLPLFFKEALGESQLTHKTSEDDSGSHAVGFLLPLGRKAGLTGGLATVPLAGRSTTRFGLA